MTPPSNEVLAANLSNMIDQNNKEHHDIKDQNKKDHLEVKTMFSELSKKIDVLEKKYVTRLEFKAVSLSLWLLATLLGVIWFFMDK